MDIYSIKNFISHSNKEGGKKKKRKTLKRDYRLAGFSLLASRRSRRKRLKKEDEKRMVCM